jgi:hypothetical protein
MNNEPPASHRNIYLLFNLDDLYNILFFFRQRLKSARKPGQSIPRSLMGSFFEILRFTISKTERTKTGNPQNRRPYRQYVLLGLRSGSIKQPVCFCLVRSVGGLWEPGASSSRLITLQILKSSKFRGIGGKSGTSMSDKKEYNITWKPR